jgi:hypothetical protein
MDVVIDQPHLIDTLRYRVMAHKTLAQEDVRMLAQVVALVRPAERDQPALDRRIREALAAFIDADWTFSRIERQGEAGYERVTLTVSARVKAAENYDLAERARRASREGLTIGMPRADYSLSRERIDTVFDELRLEILRRIGEQAQAISAATGRAWRLGDVAFGAEAGVLGRAATAKGAYRDEGDALFAAIDDVDPDRALAGAERITLVAAVVLKSAVPGGVPASGYVINA